jgi:hypothetical protein
MLLTATFAIEYNDSDGDMLYLREFAGGPAYLQFAVLAQGL